jgi:hypothetical protein
MPPKTITSYFTKPAQAAAVSTVAAKNTPTKRSLSPKSPSKIDSANVIAKPSGTSDSKATATQEASEPTRTPGKTNQPDDQHAMSVSTPKHAGPSSSPVSVTASGKKRSVMTDAMRQAIAEGLAEGKRELEEKEEREAKRAKVESAPAKPSGSAG